MQDPSRTTGGRKAFYEPLTADNAAVLLVDHQVGLFTGVVDIDVLTLKHNVVALAKAAKVLTIPTILTATAPDGEWGPTIPELLAARPDLHVLARTTVNPWDEPRFTHVDRGLSGLDGHPGCWARLRCVCGHRCFGHLQSDEAGGGPAAHAAGRGHRHGLCHDDG